MSTGMERAIAAPPEIDLDRAVQAKEQSRNEIAAFWDNGHKCRR